LQRIKNKHWENQLNSSSSSSFIVSYIIRFSVVSTAHSHSTTKLQCAPWVSFRYPVYAVGDTTRRTRLRRNARQLSSQREMQTEVDTCIRHSRTCTSYLILQCRVMCTPQSRKKSLSTQQLRTENFIWLW